MNTTTKSNRLHRKSFDVYFCSWRPLQYCRRILTYSNPPTDVMLMQSDTEAQLACLLKLNNVYSTSCLFSVLCNLQTLACWPCFGLQLSSLQVHTIGTTQFLLWFRCLDLDVLLDVLSTFQTCAAGSSSKGELITVWGDKCFIYPTCVTFREKQSEAFQAEPSRKPKEARKNHLYFYLYR